MEFSISEDYTRYMLVIYLTLIIEVEILILIK
jgi:hypothetical protein